MLVTQSHTITVSVPATAQAGDYITVHDTLDEHLAFKADTLAAHIESTTGTEVTLTDGQKKVDTETFAKKFQITEAMIGKSVLLTYNAELLSTAADDTGYVNTTFANDDSYETVPSQVKVYTFDITVDKTFTGVAAGSENSYTAKFELRKAEDNTALSFTTDSTGYVLADSSVASGSKTTELSVTGGPAINIRGLSAGIYHLVETSTAEGFNMLADPIVITITDTTTGTQPDITPSHTVTYKIGTNGSDANGTDKIEVVNNTGSVLPSTGGSGTTMLYIIGVILLAGAGILLVTRRRMKAE
jgi:LPXTG-motif cell wall-anchored protein